MQYWINHRGVQSGPVELDALKEMGLTSAAYVWHEGLSDWVKITQLPELQGLYEIVNDTPAPQQATTATAQAQPQGGNEPAVMGQPYQPQQQSNNQSQQQYAQPQTPDEPCPPTNLVWAILATVLCCIPFGIVGIIYANKVSKCYLAGDLIGAKKASETSAWWCIAAIVVGVVWRPLSMSFMGIG